MSQDFRESPERCQNRLTPSGVRQNQSGNRQTRFSDWQIESGSKWFASLIA